jgi:ferredoxin/flavodoxin---NADP+ reductase
MPHVVTQSCCSDGSCVYACPVNCIQPTPDDPDFALAEMLYVDPATCVDCGACVSACPVDAIKPQSKLTEAEQPFLKINADYFRTPRPRPLLARPVPALQVRHRPKPLRVAIVGSGPAAMYAADEILTVPGARVDVYERLTVPYGLARTGVAPDHPRTRSVSRQFDMIRSQSRLKLLLGVEVGRDVSHEELLAGHHAVIYAVGASTDRRLDVPGMGLPGTGSATEFVAWYNGHPDFAERDFDLSGPRAVVIGNGNVALDVARILTVDPERLAGTDIAPAALATLRRSRIEEVVVVGRRGPAESAFTLPELVGLSTTPGVELAVEMGELPAETGGDPKLELLRSLGPGAGTGRRIRLRYRLRPARIIGTERAEAVEFARTDADGAHETVLAAPVLTSIGYRGVPVPGLPFDEATGTVPNAQGRVLSPDGAAPLPGAYVAGWIKRGPSGFIGTNKSCAQETVRELVADFSAGRLDSASVGGVHQPPDVAERGVGELVG